MHYHKKHTRFSRPFLISREVSPELVLLTSGCAHIKHIKGIRCEVTNYYFPGRHMIGWEQPSWHHITNTALEVDLVPRDQTIGILGLLPRDHYRRRIHRGSRHWLRSWWRWREYKKAKYRVIHFRQKAKQLSLIARLLRSSIFNLGDKWHDQRCPRV